MRHFRQRVCRNIRARYTRYMKLFSSAFNDSGSIPAQYTCDGVGVSLPLEFVDVPAEAKSLVLIMDDPDVPHTIRPDGLWDHWVLWNIPATCTGIPEGATPPGQQGLTTSVTTDYDPPCPPDREHRYFIRLYALDTMLTLAGSAVTRRQLEQAMEGHIIATAELMGRYERNHSLPLK